MSRDWKLVPYSKATPHIKDGDVLLFRGKGLISHIIMREGRGDYSHVGYATWAGDVLEIVEFREFKGGRGVALEVEVENNPGIIDVYRPTSIVEMNYFNGNEVVSERFATNAKSAANSLRKSTGRAYGWGSLWLASLRHMLFIRWFMKNPKEDLFNPKSPTYCSQAVAMHWRLSNTFILKDGTMAPMDLVPNLPDWLTEPSDIARSSYLTYLMTLEPDSKE